MEHVDLVRRQHDARRDRSADHRPAEARVERDELLDRHLGQARREAHVDVAHLGDGGEIGLVRDRAERDAEGLGVDDDVLQRLQLGDVVPRLLGHGEARVVGRLAGRPVLRDGARHRALAPVVRRERELPVAVHLVELGQVVERRIGRFHDVAARVVPPVLLEVEALPGAGDELPDSRGMGARVGHRIERALHHRQQRELHRHAALLDLFDDVVEVRPAAVDDALHVLRAHRVVAHLLAHQGPVQVLDREAQADALPHVVDRRGAVDARERQAVLDFLPLTFEYGRRLCHGRPSDRGGYRSRRINRLGRRLRLLGAGVDKQRGSRDPEELHGLTGCRSSARSARAWCSDSSP